ncbi:hypothetical protein BJ741DRAFT_625456 [Chytriomyces cf. hyalinus JEL632]|nr:hypothetical protein BJ741DRAFT_625456 [Chytriomyces cf. hyalinus JEL632]
MTPTVLILILAATFHSSSAQKDSSPLCGLCSTRTGEEIGCDSGLTCEANKSIIGGSLGICVQPLQGSAACPSAAGTTAPAASTRTGPVAATLAVMSNASASSAVTSSASPALAASNSSSSSSSPAAASASMKSDCLPPVNAFSVVLMAAISAAVLI